MTTFWQDVRYGLRMLAKSPGFTAVVVVILAVGIGATTTMLSVIDAVLVRSCAPYKDPETLVCVFETDSYVDSVTHAAGRHMRERTSLTTFQDWRRHSHVFASLVGAHQWDSSVLHADETEKARALYVSPEFFSTLGARPILGRTFAPDEEKPGGERVAILSYTHWQHWFSGDPNVIGRTLTVDQQVCTVVGVLPPGFQWVFQRIACGLWMPMALHPDQTVDRNDRGLVAIGRLRPGVGLSQAQAEMDVIAAQLGQQYPDPMGDRGINVVPIDDEVRTIAVGLSKPRMLGMMLGLVASVLLIACLHIASLLITRSTERGREIVVRTALGAHRLRLIRQLLTESVLLAGLGGFAGALLTYWILGTFSALRGQSVPWYLGSGSDPLIPWFLDVRMDARSLVYIMAVSLLTCVTFGLLPALGVSKVRLNEALSEGRMQSQTPRFHRLRAWLMVLDIAVAFVLLVGAGLLVNSYLRLNTGLGYKPGNVLSARVVLDEGQPPYSQPSQCLAFFEQVLDQARRLPGVRYATVADWTPVMGGGNFPRFRIEGHSPAQYRSEDREGFPAIRWQQVFPDYFRVVGVPLSQGREFTEQDRVGTAPVIIVNEAMARRFWPNESAVGKYVAHVREERTQDGDSRIVMHECRIIGVAGNVRHVGGLKPDLDTPEAYVPYAQNSQWGDMYVMIRTHADPRNSINALRSAVLSVDRDALIRSILPLEDVIAEYVAPQRLGMLCAGAFALVALVLACLGVYGTIGYGVSRRTHEIGIRMALGARSDDVVRMVLHQGLKFTGIGLGIGLAGAWAATRVIRSLLYEINPTDPLTFVCVALLLAGIALLAGYFPARRAARIDPMVALRHE